MNDRETSDRANDDSVKETSKDGSPNRLRSDEDDMNSPANAKGGRRTPRHRDRRKSKTSKKGRRRSSSINKRKKPNHQLVGLSKSIAKRRPTRASIHLPDDCKSRNETPSIPRRVFKALQLMRHEKFLTVVSKYLKPRSKRQ